MEKGGYFSMAKDIFFMLTGVIIAGFALKGFLVPNNFFDGGVTGISLLIHEIYGVNLSYVIFACNLPLIIVSYFTVSRRFASNDLSLYRSFITLPAIYPLSKDHKLINYLSQFSEVFFWAWVWGLRCVLAAHWMG